MLDSEIWCFLTQHKANGIHKIRLPCTWNWYSVSFPFIPPLTVPAFLSLSLQPSPSIYIPTLSPPLPGFLLLSQLLFASLSVSLSQCFLTHSIGTNDGSEWFEWTHNLNSLVGFEILQLQSVEVPHSFYLPSSQVHSSKPRAYTVTHRRWKRLDQPTRHKETLATSSSCRLLPAKIDSN